MANENTNNNSQDATNELNDLKSRILQLEDVINSKGKLNEIIKTHKSLSSKLKEIDDDVLTLSKRKDNIKTELNNNIELKEKLDAEIKEIQKIIANTNTEQSKISQQNTSSNNLFTAITNTEKQAQATYNEISEILKEAKNEKTNIHLNYIDFFGGNKITNGQTVHVEGKQLEFEKSFENLQSKISDYSTEFKAFKEEINLDFTESNKSLIAKHDEIIKNNKNIFNDLKTKIEGLLPDALTAGLCSAYSDKRKSEEESYNSTSITFYILIGILTLIAFLPVATSIYFIHIGKPFNAIINDLPKIVLAFIPIYLPLLWLAISKSKSLKLSKRLIEEYTHKETLTKTVEGLSEQIDSLNLDQEIMANQLRVKLLYNIISISSENPGKLIKDYDNPDNPIFDIIDKSISLSDSIKQASSIPGISTILEMVNQRTEKQKEIISEAVNDGIEDNKKINKV